VASCATVYKASCITSCVTVYRASCITSCVTVPYVAVERRGTMGFHINSTSNANGPTPLESTACVGGGVRPTATAESESNCIPARSGLSCCCRACCCTCCCACGWPCCSCLCCGHEGCASEGGAYAAGGSAAYEDLKEALHRMREEASLRKQVGRATCRC